VKIRDKNLLNLWLPKTKLQLMQFDMMENQIDFIIFEKPAIKSS